MDLQAQGRNGKEGGERAILVHLHLRNEKFSIDIQEFRELALSAGAEIVAEFESRRVTPDSKYFIGKGKLEEIKAFLAGGASHSSADSTSLTNSASSTDSSSSTGSANSASSANSTHPDSPNIDIALFDHSLTPSQERNLERELKCRVLDRTGLILDIFAQRARTFEGKLQVELALLKHQSTRLIRGWTHLERQKGGIGLRGPGETQLEVDRRLIRNRIKHISARLEKVRSQREQSRRLRQRALLPTISLVGYTNAGKSTLFNKLTGADVLVQNQLFATLDPTLRAIELEGFGKVILADTVGFVSQLPHELVEAFRATLEEVNDAELLLHVIDGQDMAWRERNIQVENVLQEIGALAVPRIEVYNKIDLLPGGGTPRIERDEKGVIRKVYVSAMLGAGLELIHQAIKERLSGEIKQGKLFLPPEKARLRATLYELGVIKKESIDEETGVFELEFVMPLFKWKQFCRDESLQEYEKLELE